jgi:small nuclear ribonucleoprotein (snRNP)-like protein
MKAIFLAFIICLGLARAGSADVIRLQDGTVYIGKMASAEEGIVSIAAFGKTIRIASSQIMKTEADLTAIHEQPMEVILMDGSIIRGKIKNYDEDIGLFVELGIGELTIPLESLRVIEDPTQRTRYRGFPVQVGLSGGYYLPVGTFASSFSSGFTASIMSELSLPFLRGLFAGLDVTQFFVTYLPRTDLTYSITTATFGPSYRLLFFRTSTIPVLKDMVPWVGLGGGIAYVGAKDLATLSAFGEMDPVYFANVGLDFYIGERFFIRISARWLALQQTTQLLHLPSAGIGVAASF